MADLTMDAALRFRSPHEHKVEKWALDTSTAQTIYKGQPMILDASVDTTHARGYVDATVVDPADTFLGIALAGAVVALGDTEGNVEVNVLMSGEVGFKSAVFTDADLGKTVYMSDSSVLSVTAADNPVIGRLTRVEDGFAFVMINPGGAPTICAGA